MNASKSIDGVVESDAGYHPEIDYEHEHRCAEHEHELKHGHDDESQAGETLGSTTGELIGC